MTRLTNSAREDIQRKLLDRAFGEREAALKQEEYEIANEVYSDVWGEYATAIDSIPLDFFYPDSHVWAPEFGRFELKTPRVCPDRNPRPMSKLTATRIREFIKKRSALGAEKSAVIDELRGVLYSVTTYKRLYEIWPELKTVVSVVEAPATGTAIAVDLKELNNALDLPAKVA